MGVRQSSAVDLEVSVAVVTPWVADLGKYPQWMPLVHSATGVAAHARPDMQGSAQTEADTWDVELRAKVGVFARSKRLRMHRSVHTPSRVVFERREADGRVHAPWVLEVLLDERASGCTVTMNLEYAGNLWTAGVLDRVLAHHIDAGKVGLARVVQGT